MTWEFIDGFFRFGAISNLLWVSYLAPRNADKFAQPYITIATMISAVCFLIISAYDEFALFGPFGYLLGFVARLVIVFTWLFCLSILSDNFRMGLFYQSVLAIYIIRSFVFQLDLIPHDVFAAVSYSMRAAIYAFLIYKVLFHLSGDLLEKRRRFRIWFTVALVFGPIGFTAERIFVSNSLYIDHASPLESFGIFLISGFLLYHSTRPEEKHLFEDRSLANGRKSIGNTKAWEKPELVAADRHSLKILEQKMQEGLYREPNLTVAKLADTINVQEHRLRKLINSHLGYRNIAQYLNEFRIEEAKKRLADINERHVQVLTIAMEAGYVSLRPFNRAFKSRTGQTPTEYREEHLGAQSGLSDTIQSVHP